MNKNYIRDIRKKVGHEKIFLNASGGIIVKDGKILLQHRSDNKKWGLIGGMLELNETYLEGALREVKEETGVKAQIIKYVGKTNYTFTTSKDVINKQVHWYLMMGSSYYSKPQWEEYFIDSGYYKYHEAYHLLKFSNERQILEKGYSTYMEMKKSGLWVPKK